MVEYVLTVAIPFCALFTCAPRDAVPLSVPAIHYGDCLDLQHLPIAGASGDRRSRLPVGETVWPCGGRAR